MRYVGPINLIYVGSNEQTLFGYFEESCFYKIISLIIIESILKESYLHTWFPESNMGQILISKRIFYKISTHFIHKKTHNLRIPNKSKIGFDSPLFFHLKNIYDSFLIIVISVFIMVFFEKRSFYGFHNILTLLIFFNNQF